nr:hypothetical protein [Tanacetum cinerariifolium]
MSTQQDIYAAGSENRPNMLNKENYAPWSSRLLRYAKSRPNGKLIHDSIINGPYVRRIIPEPSDANREVPVNETFHEQTDDELTEKELKQVEADDQAIQTILLGLPEDIYAAVDSCETAQEIWLRVQQMMKDWQIIVLGIANQNPNRNGDVVAARAKGNATGNNGNQIRCYNCRGLGYFSRNYIVRPKRRDAAYLQTRLLIAQKEEAGIQLQAKEFDLMAAASDLDEIEEVNENCILKANLQQVSTSGTQTDKAPVYDSNGSAESLYNGKVLLEKHNPPAVYNTEETPQLAQESRLNMKQLNKEIKPANYTKINHLSGVFVSQMAKSREELYISNTFKMANVSKPISIPNEEFSDDTTPSVARKFLNEDEIFPIVNQVDARLQNFEIQFLKEAAKFVRDFKSLANEADESLAKHKALELEIERLLRAVVSEQKDTTKGTSVNTQFCKQSILGKPPSSSGTKLYAVTPFPKSKGLPKIDETHALSKPTTSNSVPTPQESNVVKKDNVITLGMFRINPFKPSREEKSMPNKVRASVRTKSIIVSQPHVINKKYVNSDSNGFSSTVVDNTAKTRRLQPRSNTKNDKVHFVSKSSCNKNKEVKVEEHPRNLLLSKNKKHMSSECNNIKLAIRNDKFKVVCAMCKKCLITANHDVCALNYVNNMNSHGKKLKATVSNTKNQKKQKPKAMKSKKVGSNKRLASPKPSKTRLCLRWLPTRRLFDLKGKIIAYSESESQSDCSNGDNACCSKHMTRNLKLLINFFWKFLGTVRFGNDYVVAILGFSNLQWGNILIIRVYFVEGLRHNLFSVGQFCDSDLEVTFIRNTCFVRNLEGVDLLKGNHTKILYTINLHEMASTSLICLMARATSTNSCLSHQRLSHLNFDAINDLAKNDLVTDLLNSKQRKKQKSISPTQGKSKTPCEQGARKKQNNITPQQNRVVEQRNQTLVEAARTMLIFSHAPLFLWAKAIATACFTQNSSIIHRRFNKTPHELINGRKPDISFLHVFGAFFIPRMIVKILGSLVQKKIMETMIVTFDELSAMAFEQSSSKPGLQSMTYGQISSGLDLTYALSTVTTQQPTESELDLLFKATYDDYIGGQPSATPRTALAAQAPQDSGFELIGFLDADHAGCKDTFKSTFSGVQFLGEKLVSWSSMKQDCTSLSTTEAEYVSLSACCA